MKALIALYRKHKSVREAARQAGIPLGTAYYRLRQAGVLLDRKAAIKHAKKSRAPVKQAEKLRRLMAHV